MQEMTWQDLQEIQELKAQYFYWMDNRQWDALRRIFTEEARFEGFPFEMAGPDGWVAGLRAFFTGVVSQHRGTNPRFRQVADDRVRGIWSMTDHLTWEPDTKVYRGIEIPRMYGLYGYGYYEEEYVRTSAGWRIDFMRLTRVRIDPLVDPKSPTPGYDTPAPTLDWIDGV